MPKIDLTALPGKTGSGYPSPHDRLFDGRRQQRLGDPAGLTQFGANLVELEPGAMSSLRHWHENQDEFLVVIRGALTLMDDDGATPLAPGDCCAFPAGEANGHHIVNRSDAPGAFVVVGTRTRTETAWYSDVDMKVTVDEGAMTFTRRDGTPMLTETTELPSAPDFTRLEQMLTHALLAGDFDLYRAVFTLPCEMAPRGARAVRFETEEALRQDLILYISAMRVNHVTDIYREVLSETRLAADRVHVVARVTFLSHATRVVAPLDVHFYLRWTGTDWRFERIESSLGHLNWTRGEADIVDGRFDVD